MYWSKDFNLFQKFNNSAIDIKQISLSKNLIWNHVQLQIKLLVCWDLSSALRHHTRNTDTTTNIHTRTHNDSMDLLMFENDILYSSDTFAQPTSRNFGILSGWVFSPFFYLSDFTFFHLSTFHIFAYKKQKKNCSNSNTHTHTKAVQSAAALGQNVKKLISSFNRSKFRPPILKPLYLKQLHRLTQQTFFLIFCFFFLISQNFSSTSLSIA